MRFFKLSTISFAAALSLSSCATTIPNIEAVSPIEIPGLPQVAASGQFTNSDDQRLLNHDAWFDFLYAQPERPDPAHPGQTLPAKGPAVCVSSIDWAKNETAIAQLCIHGKCSYEQKQAVVRSLMFHNRTLGKGPGVRDLVRANIALAKAVMAAPSAAQAATACN